MTTRAVTAPRTARTISYEVEAGEYTLIVYGRFYQRERTIRIKHPGTYKVRLHKGECADLKIKDTH